MTTDKARAEAEAIMWRHALQPEHGRRFIPDPEAMTAAIADALTAHDAEAEKCDRCGEPNDKCPSARTRTKNAALHVENTALRKEAEGLREAVRECMVFVWSWCSLRARECGSKWGDFPDWHPDHRAMWDRLSKVCPDHGFRNPIAKAAIDAAGGA